MRFLTAATLAAGLTLLAGRNLSAQTVQGQVIEVGTTVTVGSGRVTLLDQSGNELDRSPIAGGQFSVSAPAAGRYRLRIDAVGYRTTVTPFFDLVAGGTLGITLQVRPQTAFGLDTVDVAGEPVPVRLADFYARRAAGRAGGGSFITRAEFDRYQPARITDVLRRMTGFMLVPNPDFGRDGDMREFIIFNARLSAAQMQVCNPLVFLDGAYAGTTATLNLDDFLDVEFVEAVETYNGAANMPVEFNRAGAECGVVSVWSREPTGGAASTDRHLELGLLAGARLAKGGFREGRVGGQVSVTFVGPLDLYGGVNVVPHPVAEGISTTRTGWQAFLALRGRPLGERSPWYLGAGASVLQVWGRDDAGPAIDSRREITHDVVLTGVALPLGSIRPVVEMHVLDAFRPARREVNLLTGFAVRLY